MRSQQFRRRMPHLGIVSLALILLLGVHVAGAAEVIGSGQAGGSQAITPTGTKLTVTSIAYVRNQPDLATITAGVGASADTSAGAEAAVRRMLEQVGNALGERGHAVTAGHFSIYPRYDFRGDSGPIPIGFEARRTIEVAVTDVSRVGETIELLLGLGVNEINGITYGLQDESPARREAIRRALAKARVQAETVAELNGQQIVGTSSISIDSSVQTYYGGPIMIEAATSLTPSPATVQVVATVEYLLATAH